MCIYIRIYREGRYIRRKYCAAREIGYQEPEEGIIIIATPVLYNTFIYYNTDRDYIFRDGNSFFTRPEEPDILKSESD